MHCPVCQAPSRPSIGMPVDTNKDQPTPLGEGQPCDGCGLGTTAALPRKRWVRWFHDLASRYDRHMAPAAVRAASMACVMLAVAVALVLATRSGAVDHPPASTARFDPASLPTAAAPVEAPPTARLAAQTLNALTPYSSGGAAVAPPLFLGAALVDRQRAVDCLAAAAYYEAGTGPADQRSVGQVILNRLRHPAFPHTVCGVVFQGSERRTGCQFTFTCDGSLARRHPSAAAWLQARGMAEEMLSGRVEPEVGLATHYHTDWVFPSWSRAMDKIAAVKTHLFFRWRGSQGGLRAFTSSYAGSEPRIAVMGGLSSAHQTGGALPAASAALPEPAGLTALAPGGVLASAGPGLGRERLPDRLSAPEQGDYLVTLAAGDADGFRRMAEERCAGQISCRFIGWTDPARRASHLPMPGSSIDAISFQFIRTGGGMPDRARWNCAEFPRPEQDQCLRRGG